MKEYDSYSATFSFRLLLRSLLVRNPVARQSLLNRQKDYVALADRLELLPLHGKLNHLAQQAAKQWDAYDYGQAYFYQSFKDLGVTGLRDTESRIASLALADSVTGKDVFEVGCNTGFLSLQLAQSANAIDGIELNPYLVDIARLCAEFLDVDNVDFIATSFEDFAVTRTYDVVLSLANHSTYDGQTDFDLSAYFEKCLSLLKQDGKLVFESHARGHEHPSIENTISVLGEFFEIESVTETSYGTDLDRGRTKVIAAPKD